MNQVYRYDYFMKAMPLSEAALAKMFSDEHTSVISRRRRNAIMHRGDFIEIMPGNWEVRDTRRIDERRRRDLVEEEYGGIHTRNMIRPFPGNESRPNLTIRIIPSERLNAVES